MRAVRNAVRPAVEELSPRVVPAFTFVGQQAFAVGATPVAAAAVDINGDGKPDVVTVNSDSNSVSVLLNTTPAGAASPSFAAQQTFAVGSTPFAVAAADFNGDGKMDLAVANFGDGTVTVLLNTTPVGSATVSFAEPQTFQVGGDPQALAAADFNGDGKPDLAVANLNDNTVSVLRNATPVGAASASFSAQQTFATGANPIGVAAGDFNGDGRPDLAITNFGDGTISVLLDKTAPGSAGFLFGAQKTFAVGSGPLGVTAVDVNGDGRPDLAVTNAQDNTVSVLLDTAVAGAADPAFSAQQVFPVGREPQTVTAGDFDGDGRPDLAVANYDDQTVSVLRNTALAGAAAAAFAPQQTFSVGDHPVPVAVADFNGDGRADFAVADSGAAAASVVFNPAPAGSAAAVVVAQFGNQGVWQYSPAKNSWQQLTGANAAALGTDSQGDVAGAFPGYGVWLFQPAVGWQQINGVDATALTMSTNGTILAQFPSYGLGEYLPVGGWRLLTPSTATLLGVDAAGDVVAEFPGWGVWEIKPGGGWQQLNTADANLLAVNPQGRITANFPNVGVGVYVGPSWSLVDGTQAAALTVTARGDIVASFPGVGVGEFFAAGGAQLLTGANAALLAAGDDADVFGAFPGSGVWEFDPTFGWVQLTGSDARLLVGA